ncbi:MAG: hypothetical protein L0I24_05410 [Pseudonocardia sp.]|nr:hypothetical protein [Pseudonocardia sp.]
MAVIDGFGNLSATDWWPVRTVLLLLGALCLLATVLAFVRRAPIAARIGGAVLTLALVLVNAAAAVNAHYDYFPTIGEALGEPPADEGTLAAADADHGAIPAQGQVVPFTIPPTESGLTAGQALVYVPPAWFAVPRPALPVIMLLHGSPGDPTNWTDGGAAPATADAFAAAHGGTAPVLVMPDINGSLTADSECVDSPLGKVETYLTVDVPAAVAKQFATQPTGKGWAVAGLSEGGSCSIMLALRHPDLFATFGDYGGLAGPRVGETNADTADTVTQLFAGSQQQFAAHEPSTLLGTRNPAFRALGGWFEVGTGDAEPLAAIKQLAPLARTAGIATCVVTIPGAGHTFDVWSGAFRSSLPWMAARFGLAPPDPSTASACQAPS